MSLVLRVRSYGRMIRFSHSVFALPFALSAVVLAARDGVTMVKIAWIVVAVVAARSAAMGFNRLADHWIDARNPRTADRELPSGILRRAEVWVFVALSALVFVWAASRLNQLCLALSPLALLIVMGYSFAKRVTALSQFLLGLALAMAPVGAWLGLRGAPAFEPVLIGLAVLAWVAGFDTIYACQDVDFDRGEGLHSLPVRLGVPGALRVARALHALAVLLLLGLFFVTPLHPSYLGGVALVAAVLVWQHRLVSASDTSQAMRAFNLNGWIGVLYLLNVGLARWLA